MLSRLLLLLGICVLSTNGQLLQRLFGNACLEKNIPSGMCAVLFDEDKCRGWEEAVPEGYTKLGRSHKNDAESLIVRKGCILTGWDHASSKVGKRGASAVFDGRNFDGPSHYWKNLNSDSLEEEISAVTCECPKPPSAKGGGSSSGPNNVDPNSNARPGACRPVPQTACAILYDDKDCEDDDFKGLIISPGEKKSFSRIRSPLNYKYHDEIESFSVRKGCTLEAYDDSDFDDDRLRATAKNGDLHVNLGSHPDKTFRDLDSDIESVICNC